MEFKPFISDDVWSIAPSFKALSVIVHRIDGHWNDRMAGAVLLEDAVSRASAGPAWADAHMAAWAETFRVFGAKPQRTPCSAQSLRDRVLKSGGMASINPIVDLYNAVSLRFAVPVGGENMKAYRGSPALVVAKGDEPFDTMSNGASVVEYPSPGEVVWRDDLGVTCRRWNWRQGVRTRIDETATDMWFVLESLPPMPIEALHEAGDELVRGLRALFGEITERTEILGKA